MSQALALLQRLRSSPYAALAARSGVAIVLGPQDDALRIRSPEGRLGVYAAPPAPDVDGTILCSAGDRARMARGEAPLDGVRLVPGARAIAPRRRQAHLVLIAAALGWDGPWPDPDAAPGHRALVREALADLAIGPRDGGYTADGMDVRRTDGAAGSTLLLDTGLHALRLDLGAREPVEPALQRLVRLGQHLRDTGEPLRQAAFGGAVWALTPDPAFPCGWTMPEGIGAVWAIRAAAPADQRPG